MCTFDEKQWIVQNNAENNKNILSTCLKSGVNRKDKNKHGGLFKE